MCPKAHLNSFAWLYFTRFKFSLLLFYFLFLHFVLFLGIKENLYITGIRISMYIYIYFFLLLFCVSFLLMLLIFLLLQPLRS